MLNFVAPETKIVLAYANSVGGVDITPLVETFSISRPRVEPATVYSWSGSMTLITPLNQEFLPHIHFLDDLEPSNPYRGYWQKGIGKILIYFRKKLFTTLRVSEYFYNEIDGTAEIQLKDILGLLDFKSPGKDYKDMGFTPCQKVSLSAVIKKAATEAGLSLMASSRLSFYTIPVPPNKPSGSWINYIQQNLGERGLWLYLRPNERAAIIAYPKFTHTLFSAALTQVEEYARSRSPEVVYDKYVVTGSIEKFTDCAEDGTQTRFEYDTVNGIKVVALKEISSTETLNRGKRRIEKVELFQDLSKVIPEVYKRRVLAKSLDSTITSTYDDQGRKLKSFKKVYRLLGAALPEVFPKGNRMVEAEVEIIEFSKNIPGTASDGKIDDGVLKGKITETKKLFASGTWASKTKRGTLVNAQVTPVLLTATKVIESWDKGASDKGVKMSPIGVVSFGTGKSKGEESGQCECNDYLYKITTLERTQVQVPATERWFVTTDNKYTESKPFYEYTGLNFKDADSKPNNAPASWETSQPNCPTCQANVRAIVHFSRGTVGEFDESEKEFSFSTLTSLPEAREYGRLLGNLAYQRYYARSITLPIPNQFINDSSPFPKVAIHNSTYILDAPVITYAQEQAELSFTGNYLGRLPQTIKEPKEVFPPQSNVFYIYVDTELAAKQNELLLAKIFVLNQPFLDTEISFVVSLPTSGHSQFFDELHIIDLGEEFYLSAIPLQSGIYPMQIVATNSSEVATTSFAIIVEQAEIAVPPITEIINISAVMGADAIPTEPPYVQSVKELFSEVHASASLVIIADQIRDSVTKTFEFISSDVAVDSLIFLSQNVKIAFADMAVDSTVEITDLLQLDDTFSTVINLSPRTQVKALVLNSESIVIDFSSIGSKSIMINSVQETIDLEVI